MAVWSFTGQTLSFLLCCSYFKKSVDSHPMRTSVLAFQFGLPCPFCGLFTFSRPTHPTRTFVPAVPDEYFWTAQNGPSFGKSVDSRLVHSFFMAIPNHAKQKTWWFSLLSAVLAFRVPRVPTSQLSRLSRGPPRTKMSELADFLCISAPILVRRTSARPALVRPKPFRPEIL